MSDKPYLVPRAVLARFELIPGVGTSQILAGLVGAVVGALLQFAAAFIAGLVLDPSPWIMFLRIGVVAAPTAFAFGIMRQGFAGQSPGQVFMARRTWMSRPKLYLYRREGN